MTGKELTRRGAIGGFVVIAGAAATAARAETPDRTTEDADARVRARYRESDHVRAFYRVNRYPCQGGRSC